MQNGDLQSRTIDFLRFPLILYVVLIHTYTSTRGVIANDLYPGYRFVSLVLSLEIAQVAVPTFFFISGYLFFHKRAPYPLQLQKHARTLLIPYLFWNLIVLAGYFLLESIPSLKPLFSGDNALMRDLTAPQLLREFWDGGNWDRGNGTPIVHQFWYIRNLILLVLLSPLVAAFVRLFRWGGVAAWLLLWISLPGQAFLACSAAFFTAGACFGIENRDFLPVFRRYAVPVYILYPIFVALNTLLREKIYLLPLDRIGFILGMLFTFNLVAWLLEKGIVRNSLLLSGSAFMIFALHDPLLTLLRRGTIRLLAPDTDSAQIMLYLLTPLLVIGLCMVVFSVLKRFSPRLLQVISGGRQNR